MKYLLALLTLATTVAAQSPLERRIEDVRQLINGSVIVYDSVFAQSFLAAVPPENLRAGIRSLTGALGTCTSITVNEKKSDYSASATAAMSAGYTIPVSITVDEAKPHRIVGLFLRPPVKQTSSLDAIVADFKALQGSASFFAVNLSKRTVLAALDTTRAMPIGSTFKLYVLGELARSVSAGERGWADVITMDSSLMSHPSGITQEWPVGAPVTLHSLATLMISISDNTATDHLLFTLGRKNVEKMQATMNHHNPSLNVPFLGTRELFHLKFVDNGAPARAYATANTAERLRMLNKIALATDTIEFTDPPMLPDSVEWFARTTDCVAAMEWFRTTSGNNINHPAMQILAVNRGLDISKTEWPYVGYKGGSESGVLNMTFLLRHRSGDWYGVSASWLRTDGECNLGQFSGLLEGAIRLLAP